LNENAHRAYPLVEDSDRTTSGGVFPDNVLLDFQLLDFATAAASVYITQLVVSGSFLDITIAYGSVTRQITTTLVAVQHTPVNYGTAEPYRITTIFGPGVEEVIGWGDGTYAFANPAEIEPALLNFEDRHRVDSIQALDPSANEVLVGVIHVREGYNCRVNIMPDADKVIVTASRGSGRGITCEEDDGTLVLCGDVLLNINGLVSDSEGNFVFLGGPGINVAPGSAANTVTFTSGLSDTDKTRCG
jgi:hypothetical protein